MDVENIVRVKSGMEGIEGNTKDEEENAERKGSVVKDEAS